MVQVSVLEAAAKRATDYMHKYGVLLDWSLSEHGLQLSAHHGGNSISKVVSWTELSTALTVGRLLERAEHQALQGLST
ncbi:hypothetical protein [Roseobacter phage RDJL6]|nr:hypothetical protein [Roseobacter phage RDJL6]